ncbi:hypothetical protein NMG60_11006876 [Bertholletia excelsa]
MGSTFNPQILIDKLAKLNNSQQSIETLSHWCIFHMNKAKLVVETWARQFHCSPREQRLAFLYLANDILQNSRRKGSEFVGEFWKVLPDALCDVIENGDEFGRTAAVRLVSIWEERKVFGSRGQILKEEMGRHLESSNRSEKHLGFELRNSGGNALDKIVLAYQAVYSGQLDEDALLSKCRKAISCIGDDINSEELQEQHSVLKDCIEQLTAVESSRASLVSHLREALQEQETKLNQIHSQLQVAQSQSEQAGSLCRLLMNNNSQLLAQQSINRTQIDSVPLGFRMGNDGGQSTSIMYSQQLSVAEKSGGDPKATAAAVAAKLTESASSAQMLTYVLSSLASEGVIGSSMKESSRDYPSEKRTRIENGHQCYVPTQNPPQAPFPPYPHPGSMQHNIPVTTQELSANEQLVSPSSAPSLPPLLPPMQPYPVPQFMQTSGSITVPLVYSTTQHQPPPMPCYPAIGASANGVSPFAAPSNTYPSFQGSEGGFYSQPSSLSTAPFHGSN